MAALYLFSLLSKGAIFLAFLHKIYRLNRCRVMGRLCFLVALCSVMEFYKRVFQGFVGFLLMSCTSVLKVLLTKYNDFGFGVLVFECFSKICNVLVFFFMFILGFKVLKFGGHFKFGKPGTTGMSRVSDNSGGCEGQKLDEIDEVVSSNRGFQDERGDFSVEDEGEEELDKECCDEDQEFDVMSLRKMVKFERRRANAASSELDKERTAASSAAAEAMAMILRLQNEKSSLQMQANQLQRLAEEKQLYDQDVIQSLQWIVMKHESERSLLEDQLKMCREKLKLYVKGEEWDQFDSVYPTPSTCSSSFDGSKFEVVPISSLDLEFSSM